MGNCNTESVKYRQKKAKALKDRNYEKVRELEEKYKHIHHEESCNCNDGLETDSEPEQKYPINANKDSKGSSKLGWLGLLAAGAAVAVVGAAAYSASQNDKKSKKESRKYYE